MNRITNLLVLLLLISFILPATAIKHASGSTDNDTASSGEATGNNNTESSGESTDNKASTSGESTDNNKDTAASSDDSTKIKDSSHSESSDNNNNVALSSGESPDNKASSSGNSTESNSPGSPQETNNAGSAQGPNNIVNGQQESNNATTGMGIRESSNNETAADFAKNILTVHNGERTVVGVKPLVWSDKLAADAKTWADHLVMTREFVHCGATPGCDTHGEGENMQAQTFFLPNPPSTKEL